MLNKIKAICNFRGINVNDIERILDGEIFIINNEECYEEYYVLTNKEAEEMFIDIQKQIIDDIGIAGFTEYGQNYIINNCLNIKWFNEVMNESHEDYIDNMYEEELQEYLDDYNLNTKEELLENFNNQYENGLEYFKEIYDDKDLIEVINKNNLMDINKVIEFCKEVDGRGHTISTFNSEEYVEEVDGIKYYIYRIC